MAGHKEQHALWDAVGVIHRYYEELFRPVASTFSLTVGQLKLLHTLHRYGALPVGELAALLGIARTNTSSLCKKLCKQGFLLRHRGKDGDDRQVLLELTPEGEFAARRAEMQLDFAAEILREGDLVELTQDLSALARALLPQEPARTKQKKRLPGAAVRMLDAAKSVMSWGEKSKKELQHGKD